MLLAGDQLGLFDPVPVMDDGDRGRTCEAFEAADALALESLAATV